MIDQEKEVCSKCGYPPYAHHPSCPLGKSEKDLEGSGKRGGDLVKGDFYTARPESGGAARELITREERDWRNKVLEQKLENNAHPKAGRVIETFINYLSSSSIPTKEASLKFLENRFKIDSGQTIDNPKFSNESEAKFFRPLRELYFKAKDITGKVADLEILELMEQFLMDQFGIKKISRQELPDKFDENIMEAIKKYETSSVDEDMQVKVLSDAYKWDEKLVKYYQEEYLPKIEKRIKELTSEAINFRETRPDLYEIKLRQVDELEKKRIKGMPVSRKIEALVRPARVIVYRYEKT